MPPLEFVGQARELRDESRRLSERTRKPGQLADLHVVTGGACALLAMASWDLGAWSAAIEQAHAAGIYGEIVGHRGLQAWAAGCEGLIVFWRGRPREAADVIGISRAQVSNLLNSGKLGYYQVGGRRIIGERHLQEYLSIAERRSTESEPLTFSPSKTP